MPFFDTQGGDRGSQVITKLLNSNSNPDDQSVRTVPLTGLSVSASGMRTGKNQTKNCMII